MKMKNEKIKISCPKCGGKARIYSSDKITENLQRRYHECRSCGFKFNTLLEQSMESITASIDINAPEYKAYVARLKEQGTTPYEHIKKLYQKAGFGGDVIDHTPYILYCSIQSNKITPIC